MGSALKLKALTKPKLLIVEGDDDEFFVQQFLVHERIADVEIINCGGESNFDAHILAATKISGFNLIKKFGAIKDAETNNLGSFASLKGGMAVAGLTPPNDTLSLSTGTPHIGIFLIPFNGKDGMLEDLCIASVQSSQAMACVDPFVKCTSGLAKPPLNRSKSAAKAYLAAMPESVPHVGIGALKGYWDFSSPAMNDLRSFLRLFS